MELCDITMIKNNYIEQCKVAHQLIALKMKLGFNEGDYVYDGEKVRLIGHDFISLTKKWHPEYPYFQFAMLEAEPNLFIEGKYYPHEITMKYGMYKTETIYNPIWIPTQEQLQNLLPCVDYTTLLNRFIHFTNVHNSYHKLSSTKEQLWLDYFMWKKFDVVWDCMTNEWEPLTYKLSE